MTDDDDGFLGRWSRRKLAARQVEPDAETEAVAEEQASLEAEEAGQEAAGAPHPAEEIDIESLTRESDFTVFMGKGVPADIRRQALRKLWASDPAYAKIDRLTDFFDVEDTRTWGLGDIRKTAWQLGRGFQAEDEVAPPPRRHDAPEPEEAGEEAVVAAGEPEQDLAEEEATDNEATEATEVAHETPVGAPDETERS